MDASLITYLYVSLSPITHAHSLSLTHSHAFQLRFPADQSLVGLSVRMSVCFSLTHSLVTPTSILHFESGVIILAPGFLLFANVLPVCSSATRLSLQALSTFRFPREPCFFVATYYDAGIELLRGSLEPQGYDP